ncbi:MAG: carbon-nitrogen hydrolase family protein [Nanoarchaeota archaeon]
MKIKIAVVQFEVKLLSSEENIKRAERFIKKASGLNADLIVFPEYFLREPVLKKRNSNEKISNYKKYFQNLAKKYNIDIIPGSFIENNGKKKYNTSYYIDSTGKIISKYRKINLWSSEKKELDAGNKICVFNTRYGKVGLIICWDLAFPEVFRKMEEKGVKIVICPSYWCYGDAGKGIKYDKNSERKFINSLCIDRAFENEIILVYCNAGGKLNNKQIKDKLIGSSQITVPFKGAVKKLRHNREMMFVQEVDTSILKDAEKAYAIRKDMKNDKKIKG